MLEREKEIAKEQRRLSIEVLALKSFCETGRFTLAIPGHQRWEWFGPTASQAPYWANQAAWIAMNTEPRPMSLSTSTRDKETK